MPRKPGQRLCVIGVDIGGTKIKIGAVALDAASRPTTLVASTQIPTPCTDPAAFYTAIASALHEVREQAMRDGAQVLDVCAVAHPGRFLPDGTLARGTTPNLGSATGQFDGLRPAEELQRRVGGVVVAENDAVAQMRYGLHLLLNDPVVRPQLLGQTVVYLGPGTGMGGGVARVDAQGTVTVITDGHLFDLQVPGQGDGTWTAEELFTGPALAKMVAAANHRVAVAILPATAEQVTRLLADPQAPREHRALARQIADEAGDILALLIHTIHQGRIVKVRVVPLGDGWVARHVDEPDRAWSADDRAAVRGVRRFLLGGSIGTDPILGAHLRRRALTQLAQRGLGEIAIFQMPSQSAEAGVLGAVMGIPVGEGVVAP